MVFAASGQYDRAERVTQDKQGASVRRLFESTFESLAPKTAFLEHYSATSER